MKLLEENLQRAAGLRKQRVIREPAIMFPLRSKRRAGSAGHRELE